MVYVCKYIGKIDEQNFVVTKVNGDSVKLVDRYVYLQNIKVTISKIIEDKAHEKDRDIKKPQGLAISQNIMIHGILGYAEVNTNIKSIQVST